MSKQCRYSMKATAVFNNDSSVGIYPEWFEMDLPFDEFNSKEDREDARDRIKKLYTDLNGEFCCSYVLFSDEKQEY